MAGLINVSHLVIFISFLSLVTCLDSCEDQGLHQCPNSGRCYLACDGVPQCQDGSDEVNCTSIVSRQPIPGNISTKPANLAWLITPCLLLLGVAYLIYKCVKDGVCRAIRRRITHGWRANRELRASDYHPLHQVNFFTSTQIPCGQTPAGAAPTHNGHHQFMVVHNQTFSIQFRGQPPDGIENISIEGATGGRPPTYEEATKMAAAQGGTVVTMNNGSLMVVPKEQLAPPPYPGASGGRGAPVRSPMDRIEEEQEEEARAVEAGGGGRGGALAEASAEYDDQLDADEETVFLPRTDPPAAACGGRRRHHSQWTGRKQAQNRRRHHSCPS